ncbi:putative sterigmatocystin biosynthesis cytochrome P450 monooxygenase [Aspergillus thermomutatus]|uniref:Uncharacterized protein n=1 Tax=Aspergillus thermomutatus TaxID=41047 RepID=A0A397HQ78_ASPTH|nr:uncharacterized protein CDV56_108468 [Aspergillus thermomutatus]RHZ63454.1 hypothetical protein CDV56_108468 [Aspergillus thermomutatus]
MMFIILTAVSFLYISYIFLSAIKTIFFHPLSHIPGPKSWIAFPLLQHLSAIRGRLDLDLRYWHERYGQVVPFGPDEVSFITAEAWKDIYGHGHRQLPKVQIFTNSGRDIISANDVDHARFRRPAATGGFAESGTAADMGKWYNLTTFDLIGDLAFGEPFEGLDISEYHHWVATMSGFIKAIPFLRMMNQYPVLFKVLLAFVPGSFMEARSKQVEHAKATVRKRLNNPAVQGRGDFMDLMLRHGGDEEGLSLEELEADANILILAGSKTTAALLSGVTAAFASETDITFNQVTAKLPYMLACLNEAFRMYPPVPGGVQRWTEAPTWISGYHIPPNTKVPGHQSAAYSSPRNFHQADQIHPWTMATSGYR